MMPTVASADSVQTYVACNQYGDCWRVHQRYAYGPDAPITYYNSDWYDAHHGDEHVHWRPDPDNDRGYYDRDGSWHNDPGARAWLGREQTERVWRLMREDLGATAGGHSLQARAAARLRIELGQPVAAGTREGRPVFALRLCLSSRLVCEASSGDPRTAARMLSDARLALAKAAWLACEVGQGRL